LRIRIRQKVPDSFPSKSNGSDTLLPGRTVPICETYLKGGVGGLEECSGRGLRRGQLEQRLFLPHAGHRAEVAQLPLNPKHGIQVPLRRHDHKVLEKSKE